MKPFFPRLLLVLAPVPVVALTLIGGLGCAECAALATCDLDDTELSADEDCPDDASCYVNEQCGNEVACIDTGEPHVEE